MQQISLEEYLETHSIPELARAVGVGPNTAWQWANRTTGGDIWITLEKGKVTEVVKTVILKEV